MVEASKQPPDHLSCAAPYLSFEILKWPHTNHHQPPNPVLLYSILDKTDPMILFTLSPPCGLLDWILAIPIWKLFLMEFFHPAPPPPCRPGGLPYYHLVRFPKSLGSTFGSGNLTNYHPTKRVPLNCCFRSFDRSWLPKRVTLKTQHLFHHAC